MIWYISLFNQAIENLSYLNYKTKKGKRFLTNPHWNINYLLLNREKCLFIWNHLNVIRDTRMRVHVYFVSGLTRQDTLRDRLVANQSYTTLSIQPISGGSRVCFYFILTAYDLLMGHLMTKYYFVVCFGNLLFP